MLNWVAGMSDRGSGKEDQRIKRSVTDHNPRRVR